MKASIVDLRYRMKEVLRALTRNEPVTILYHGKIAGTIIPPKKSKGKRDVRKHPFFGMHAAEKGSVEKEIEGLRGGRYRAI